tara:strand:+ start:358 stop:1011 length:654 start_codon:yes stop_codon:yes gene_type:complete
MKVELISKTVGVGRYKELTNEEVVAAVARHGEIKEDKGRLVQYLMNHKHWSPLQHISYGFRIETRRSISAQIFRHRSLNGQESSLRYSESIGFEEIDLRKEHPTNRQSSLDSFNPIITSVNASELIEEHNENTAKLYDKLIEAGVAKECARDILPLSSKTTIHITATLRDLLGILNVRCQKDTQKEFRDIATLIGEELEKQLPNIFKKIEWRSGGFM